MPVYIKPKPSDGYDEKTKEIEHTTGWWNELHAIKTIIPKTTEMSFMSFTYLKGHLVHCLLKLVIWKA